MAEGARGLSVLCLFLCLMPDIFDDDFSVVTDDPDSNLEGVVGQVERTIRGAFDRIMGGVRPLVEGIQEVEAHFTHLDDTIRRSQFMKGVESGLAKEIDEVASSLERWRGAQKETVRDNQAVITGLQDIRREAKSVHDGLRDADKGLQTWRAGTYEALKTNKEYAGSLRRMGEAEHGVRTEYGALISVLDRVNQRIEAGVDANKAYSESYNDISRARARMDQHVGSYQRGLESAQAVTQTELPKSHGRWDVREGGIAGPGRDYARAADAYDTDFREALSQVQWVKKEVESIEAQIPAEGTRGIIVDAEDMQRGVRDVNAAVDQIVGAVRSGRNEIQNIGNLMLAGDVDPSMIKQVESFYDLGGRAARFFEDRLESLNAEAGEFQPNVQRMNEILGDLLTGTRSYVREARGMEDAIESAGTAAGLSADQLSAFLTRFGEFRRMNVEAGLGGVRLMPGARGTGVDESSDVRARGAELQTLYAQWDEETDRLRENQLGKVDRLARQIAEKFPQIQGRVGKILGDIGGGEDDLSRLRPQFQGLERGITDLYSRLLILNTSFKEYASGVTESGQVTEAQMDSIRGYSRRINEMFDGLDSLNKVLDFGKVQQWTGSIRETFVPLDGLVNRLGKVVVGLKNSTKDTVVLVKHLNNVKQPGQQGGSNLPATRVGNLKTTDVAEPDMLYAGRESGFAKSGSVWSRGGQLDMKSIKDITGYDLGNPFPAIEGKRTREEAVKQFEEWLDKGIAEGKFKVEKLAKLYSYKLMCFCDPLACHAHIIADRVNAAYNQLSKEAGQKIVSKLPKSSAIDSVKLPQVMPKVHKPSRPGKQKVKDVTDQLTGRTSTRTGFVPAEDKPFVKKVDVDIPQYKPEVDLATGKTKVEDIGKSIRAFHARMAELLGIAEREILEVSTASHEKLGQALSAFNLKVFDKSGKREIGTVESLYQGSKVFESGPAHDLYGKKSAAAKAEAGKRGDFSGFDFFGRKFEKGDDHQFYNWLYMNALVREMPDIGKQLKGYKGFTDIYGKAGSAMQSEAVAMAASLAEQGKLTQEFLADPENLRGLVRPSQQRRDPPTQKPKSKPAEKKEVTDSDVKDYVEGSMGGKVPGGFAKQLASALFDAVENRLNKKAETAEDADEDRGRQIPADLARILNAIDKIGGEKLPLGKPQLAQERRVARVGAGSQKTFRLKAEHEEGLLRQAIRMQIADKIYQSDEGHGYSNVPDVMKRSGKFKKLVKGKESVEDLLGVLYPQLEEVLTERYKGIDQFRNLVGLSKKRIEKALKDSGLKGDELDLVAGRLANVHQDYRKQIDAAKKKVRESDAYQYLHDKERVPASQRAVSKILKMRAEKDAEEDMTPLSRRSDPDLGGFDLDVSGNRKLLERLGVAIVGNRKATEKSLKVSERLAMLFGKAGVNVVSGMASGVDTAAHIGAIKGGGTTTMVPPTGLARMRIAQHLAPLIDGVKTAFVSMFQKDTPFSGRGAMARNELIRALSESVIVVEAQEKRGGTYQMGRKALDEGKPLFVIDPDDMPGRQLGSRDLIDRGATKVGLQDIADKGISVFTNEVGEASAELRDEAGKLVNKLEEMDAVIGTKKSLGRTVPDTTGKLAKLDMGLQEFGRNIHRMTGQMFRRIELPPDSWGATAPFEHERMADFWRVVNETHKRRTHHDKALRESTGFGGPPWGDIEERRIVPEHWWTNKSWQHVGKFAYRNLQSEGLDPKLRSSPVLGNVGHYSEAEVARVMSSRDATVYPKGFITYIDNQLRMVAGDFRDVLTSEFGGAIRRIADDFARMGNPQLRDYIQRSGSEPAGMRGVEALRVNAGVASQTEIFEQLLQNTGGRMRFRHQAGKDVLTPEVAEHLTRDMTTLDRIRGVAAVVARTVDNTSKSFSELVQEVLELGRASGLIVPSLEDLDAILGTKRSLIPTTQRLRQNVAALGDEFDSLGRDAKELGNDVEGELEDPIDRITRLIRQFTKMEGMPTDAPAFRGMTRQIERLLESVSELRTAQSGLSRLMESGEVDVDVLRRAYQEYDNSLDSVRVAVGNLRGQMQSVDQQTDEATRGTELYKRVSDEARRAVDQYGNSLDALDTKLEGVRDAAREVTGAVEKKTKAVKEGDQVVKQSGQQQSGQQGVDVRWRSEEEWGSFTKDYQRQIIKRRQEIVAAGGNPWWDDPFGEPPAGYSQTGKGIREATPTHPLGIYPRRQDEAQEGDHVPRKTRKIGKGDSALEIPDFRHIGFVDLFASMEIFERIYHRMSMIVEITSEFGFAMARVAGITGTTVVEFENLTNFARKMGETTIFTAMESAEAMEELAKVGFSASSIISTLPAVLNVAAAEGMKLAKAAEILAANLKAFELQGTEAERLSNVLAAASMRTAATMEDFGVGLRTVATFAHSANVPVEETVALLGKLADAGLTPRRASVALRALIQQLQRLERGGAQRELSRIGLTVTDIDPKIVGLTTAIARLDEHIEKFGSDADKIFTLRASHAFQILSQVGEDSMRSLTDAITGTTAAADLAQRQMDTFQGAMARTKSVGEEFAISLGTGFEPIIRGFMAILRGGMGMVINLDDGIKQLIGSVVLLGAAGVSAGQLWAVFDYSGSLIVDQVRAVKGLAIQAATAFKNLIVAHPYIAAATAIGVAIAGIIGWVKRRQKAEEEAARRQREMIREEIKIREDLVSKLEQYARAGQDLFFTNVEQEQMREAAARVGDLKVEFDELGNVIFETQNELINLLNVMRQGELEFPVLKKLEDQIKRVGEMVLNTAEMVQIREFLDDIKGFGIEIDGEMFTNLRVEFDKLNNAIFKTADGVELSVKQTEGLYAAMRQWNELQRGGLIRNNITEGVLNRLDLMEKLATSLADPFRYGDPTARPGQEHVGRESADFLRDIKNLIFERADDAYRQGAETAVEVGRGAAFERIEQVTQGMRAELSGLVFEQIQLAEKWGIALDRVGLYELIERLVAESSALQKGQLFADIRSGVITPRVAPPVKGESARGVEDTATGQLGRLKALEEAGKSYYGMSRFEVAPFRAQIESVVDGDTLKIKLPSGGEAEIRIGGADTRESRGRDVPEDFSKEAAAALTNWAGDAVDIIGYRGGRTFGRDVADVRNQQGQLASEFLVGEGWARATDFPLANRKKLLALQESAMRRGLNIWSEGQDRYWETAEREFIRYIRSAAATTDDVAKVSANLFEGVKSEAAVASARAVAESVKTPLAPLPTPGVPVQEGSGPTLAGFKERRLDSFSMIANPLLEKADDIIARTSWIRNQFVSKDLPQLVYMLERRLDAYGALLEIDSEGTPASRGGMEKDQLKKEISQLRDAIDRNLIQLDKDIDTGVQNYLKDREKDIKEVIAESVSPESVLRVREMIRELQQEIQGFKNRDMLLDESLEGIEDLEDGLFDAVDKRWEVLFKERAQAIDKYIGELQKKGIEELGKLVEDADVSDFGDILNISEAFSAYAKSWIEDFKANVPAVHREEDDKDLESFQKEAITGVNMLFSGIRDRLKVAGDSLSGADIVRLLDPTSGVIPDLHLMGLGDVLTDQQIKDINKGTVSVARDIVEASLRGFTRNLDEVGGFQGVASRIRGLRMLPAFIQDIRGYYAEIPDIVWESGLQGITDSIKSTSDTLQSRLSTMLKDSIGKRLEADTSLDLSEVLEPYTDLVDLLDPKHATELFETIGADIDSYKAKREEGRRESFKAGVNTLTQGLDNLDGLMVGVAEQRVKQRLDQLVLMIKNEAQRRAADAGDPRLVGEYIRSLSNEFSAVFIELGSKLKQMEWASYAVRLAAKVDRVAHVTDEQLGTMLLSGEEIRAEAERLGLTVQSYMQMHSKLISAVSQEIGRRAADVSLRRPEDYLPTADSMLGFRKDLPVKDTVSGPVVVPGVENAVKGVAERMSTYMKGYVVSVEKHLDNSLLGFVSAVQSGSESIGVEFSRRVPTIGERWESVNMDAISLLGVKLRESASRIASTRQSADIGEPDEHFGKQETKRESDYRALPFFKSPPDYEGYWFKREKARIKREKAAEKHEYAADRVSLAQSSIKLPKGYKERMKYEHQQRQSRLDIELNYIKQFQGNQRAIRESLGQIHGRLEGVEGEGGLRTFGLLGEKVGRLFGRDETHEAGVFTEGHDIFKDLLQIEGQLDLSQHFAAFGDTIDGTARTLTTFMQRMDQSAAMMNLFNRFGGDASDMSKAFAATLAGGIAALATGQGEGGVAAAVGGGLLGGIAGSFLGDPVTGAQLGSSLGSALFSAFTNRDELESGASDSLGVDSKTGSSVTVRNTVVHIGSIVNENHFEIVEEVDVQRVSEELALQTEGEIREILV